VPDTPPAEIPPIFVSVPDAARLLAVSLSVAYDLIRAGELVSVKRGRSRLVSLQSVRDYADRLMAAAGEAS
jgi:excisionase family DNA binding protein